MAAQENKQYNFELSYTPYDFYYSTNREDLPSENVCLVLEEEKKITLLNVVLMLLLRNVINMNYVKTNI